MKRCWKCAEDIQDAAIVCRFCEADQSDSQRRSYSMGNRTTGGNHIDNRVVVERGPNSFQSCIGCVAWVVGGFVALGFIGSLFD